MAHTKQQGAASRTVNVAGKRLGIKRFGGEFVDIGAIILRQKGSKFHPGKNTGMGRDFTIYAKKPGTVSFRNMTGFHRNQKFVDVLEEKTATKTKSTSTKKTSK